MGIEGGMNKAFLKVDFASLCPSLSKTKMIGIKPLREVVKK